MAYRFSQWLSSIDLKKILGAFQTYTTKNKPVKNVCLSVCLYVCLSSSSSPIFSALICSHHHQTWLVCSLIHNLVVVFFLFFRMLYLWKHTVLHSTPFIKIVLEWTVYPIETVINQIEWCLEFTSKKWLSPTKRQKKCYISENTYFCTAYPIL